MEKNRSVGVLPILVNAVLLENLDISSQSEKGVLDRAF